MKNFMKTKPKATKKAKWNPPYKTYKTLAIAECEALKATLGVPNSGNISVFSMDGKFFFTTTCEEGDAVRTHDEDEGYESHVYEEDDISDAGWKLFQKWYKDEVTKEMKRIVPASHPQHKAIWKAYKDIADGSADGTGGEYIPKNLVECSMRMYVEPLVVWKEYLQAACCRINLGASETAEIVKQWTRGKTILECVGATEKEWQSYDVLTDGALEEFAYYFVQEELEKSRSAPNVSQWIGKQKAKQKARNRLS